MFDQPRCTVKFFAKIHVAAGPIPLAPVKWAKRQDPGEYGDRARRMYFARSERSDRAPARDPRTRGAHRLVGLRRRHQRLLQESVEQQAAVPGGAPVEPEGELVEVPVEQLAAGGALVGALQPVGQPPLHHPEVGERAGGDPREHDAWALAGRQPRRARAAGLRRRSGTTVVPGSTAQATKRIRLASAGEASGCIRTRPGSWPRSSTAMAITVRSAPAGRKVRPTSTTPSSRGRPERTIARRSLWSIDQAVS